MSATESVSDFILRRLTMNELSSVSTDGVTFPSSHPYLRDYLLAGTVWNWENQCDTFWRSRLRSLLVPFPRVTLRPWESQAAFLSLSFLVHKVEVIHALRRRQEVCGVWPHWGASGIQAFGPGVQRVGFGRVEMGPGVSSGLFLKLRKRFRNTE